ncbi:hypothetical protein [Sedimentibacter sp.]|uniref:hypothetical protein n=1 Tax=Sedimentibacter sp. TaxID=1960295 RepID=UPI0028B1A76F|nr:hypothetical protein [Sedimentibacter sp.]
MSKGNGRKSNTGKGNDMDKFDGACNGITNDSNQLYPNTYPRKPSALESKAGNFKYTNPTNKDIKEFKNKIK